MVDVRRFRPIFVVVLAFLTLLPSLFEMVTQGLSPIVVLARLTEALALIGTLVWLVSGVVFHYARIQVVAQQKKESEDR